MTSPCPARTTALTSAVAAIGMPPGEFFAGGLPVVIDGTVVAGLGVAGAMTGAEDRMVAEYREPTS